MKKAGLIFWGLFVGYFIFIHPCIIYYSGGKKSIAILANTDPTYAIILLYISIFLWSVIVGFAIYQILFGPIIKAKNFQWIQKNGVSKLASITQVKPIGKSALLDIEFVLENFSQTLIKDHITIDNDAATNSRFEKGNSVYLKIDPNFSHPPNVILQDTEFINSFGKIAFRGFLSCVIIGIVILFYSWAYSYESQGLGWRFLEISHPLLISPTIAIFVLVLLYFIFFKIFRLNKNVALLYKGYRCAANIISISETGTRINNAYKLEYALQFTDLNHAEHDVVLYNLVSPIDIGQVKSMKTVDVFYLPDDPKNVELASKVEQN